MTIPRLELTTAVVSVRISSFLQRELDYQTITSYYWMDSKVVLGYISNESKRFHIFVANRVQQIRDNTEVTAWNHVDTKENPADIASRGMGAKELLSATNWWMGPDFLRSASPLPLTSEHMPVGLEDPEVRRVTTRVGKNPGNKLIARVTGLSGFTRVFLGFVGNTGSYDNALPQVQLIIIINLA